MTPAEQLRKLGFNVSASTTVVTDGLTFEKLMRAKRILESIQEPHPVGVVFNKEPNLGWVRADGCLMYGGIRYEVDPDQVGPSVTYYDLAAWNKRVKKIRRARRRLKRDTHP